jgi:serine/threonine protein kinase
VVALKKIKDKRVSEYVATSAGDLPLEIYLSMSLHHKNIIATSGFVRDGKSWCMVMEHCPGYLDLTALIQLNSSLSHLTARKIFIQTYRALTYCFRQNIVHRDVKTDNILVHWSTHDVKLIDFGVSTFIKANTPVNEKRGTDIFMPPEFFMKASYDPLRGTVWALGCLLYCMLFGEVPFITVDEVLNKKLDLPDPSPASDPAAAYCSDLLERCLEKNEHERVTYRNISYHPWITRRNR